MKMSNLIHLSELTANDIGLIECTLSEIGYKNIAKSCVSSILSQKFKKNDLFIIKNKTSYLIFIKMSYQQYITQFNDAKSDVYDNNLASYETNESNSVKNRIIADSKIPIYNILTMYPTSDPVLLKENLLKLIDSEDKIIIGNKCDEDLEKFYLENDIPISNKGFLKNENKK